MSAGARSILLANDEAQVTTLRKGEFGPEAFGEEIEPRIG